MKVSNGMPKDLDVLGSKGDSANFNGDWRLELLRKHSGYLSVLAGVSVAVLGQANQALAKPDTNNTIPAGAQKRAKEALAEYQRSCSTPELLRSQAKFKLPGGKSGLELARMFAGGNDCPGNAVPGGTYTVAAPYLDSGSTTGANNTVTSVQAGCSNYTTTAGPDHIYGFQLSARGPSAQISMTTTTGTYDPAIYILNGTTGAMCPAGPAAAVTNCLQGADAGLAGAGETISTAEVNTLPLNTQLYLFIDSFYSTAAGNGNYTVRFQDVTVPGGPTATQNTVDFDGNGRTDFAVVRNTGGGPSGQVTWFYALNPQNTAVGSAWGIASDFFTPSDFDGDNKTDIAIWRSGPAGTAGFYILQSATQTFRFEQFGQTGDDPTVVGDYDNDNKSDSAVYRAGAAAGDQSTWFYRGSNANPGGNVTFVPWGQNGDFPAPGDYDGDGRYDFVIQRNNGGGQARFWMAQTTAGQTSIVFGTPTDVIVPGDYDGDGKTDLATIRGSGGQIFWFVRPSTTGAISAAPTFVWGNSATDFPAQGDYDGDGKTDAAIWRGSATPGASAFWVFGSTAGAGQFAFGANGDYPVANFNSH